MVRYQVGDRVTRPQDIYNKNSPLLHGEVTCVYGKDAAWPWTQPLGYIRENNKPGVWRYPELYEVRWDNGKVQRGFFHYGINPEV